MESTCSFERGPLGPWQRPLEVLARLMRAREALADGDWIFANQIIQDVQSDLLEHDLVVLAPYGRAGA